jgi:hypothetical protein
MPEAHSTLKRYGYAVILVILATVVRIALNDWFGYDRPYATFYIAVLLASWYGGTLPGLLAISLGAVALVLLALVLLR